MLNKEIIYNFQFAADYATKHLMKNLMNKIVEVKKLYTEKASTDKEPIIVTSNISDNLTPLMKIKMDKIQSHSPSKIKPITSVDDSVINKNKQNSIILKKNISSLKSIDDVAINPSSYLLNDGSINFSKLLIDEVLAADKLLTEVAKSNYDIAGKIFKSIK